MTKEDYTQFVMLWQTYQSIYRPQAPQTALAAVFEALKDFSICDITRALKEYSLNAVRAPVPADIRKILTNESDNIHELNALGFLTQLDSKLDRACDYISQDWRGVRAFKETYLSLVNYCNLTIYVEQQLKSRFVENYKRSAQTGNIEADHLIPGIYHHNENVKVRPLETYAENKKIIDQIYQNKKISLCLSSHDPAYKKLNYLPEQNYKLDDKAEANVQNILQEYPSANIDALSDILKKICG